MSGFRRSYGFGDVAPLRFEQSILNHFQKPYSFEAQSEPTIEIIDALSFLIVNQNRLCKIKSDVLSPPIKTSAPALQAFPPVQPLFFAISTDKCEIKILNSAIISGMGDCPF